MVTGGVHVRDAVRGNALLCRVTGGNLRQDHEPSGSALAKALGAGMESKMSDPNADFIWSGCTQ